MNAADTRDEVTPEPYCSLCEREGHTARSCPSRDEPDDRHLEADFGQPDAWIDEP